MDRTPNLQRIRVWTARAIKPGQRPRDAPKARPESAPRPTGLTELLESLLQSNYLGANTKPPSWGKPACLMPQLGILVPLVALKQLQLVVRGRVQGVFFRASTQREARRLGLSGWVKNRPDGTMEVLVEGEETAIRELYSWAQKGPSAARVERVDARWRSFTGEFPDFRITE